MHLFISTTLLLYKITWTPLDIKGLFIAGFETEITP